MNEIERQPFPLKDEVEFLDTALCDSVDLRKLNEQYQHYWALLRESPENFGRELEQHLDKLFNKSQTEASSELAIPAEVTLALILCATHSLWGEGKTEADQAEIARKRAVQLRAVAEMAVGNSPAVDTGDGKSTAILPSFALFSALFTPKEKPAIIMTSFREKEVRDLSRYTGRVLQRFLDLLPKSMAIRSEVEARVQLVAPAENVENDSELENLLSKTTIDPLARPAVVGQRIVFLTHDKLIHSLEAKPDFREKFPHTQIVMDEAHFALSSYEISSSKKNSASISQKTAGKAVESKGRRGLSKPEVDEDRPKVSLDNEYIRDDIVDYALVRLIQEQLIDGADKGIAPYVFVGEGVELSDIAAIRLKRIRKFLAHDRLPADDLFTGVLRTVAGRELSLHYDFGCSEEELVNKLFQHMQTRLTAMNENQEYAGEQINDAEELLAPDEFHLLSLAEGTLSALYEFRQGMDYIDPSLLRSRVQGILQPGMAYNNSVDFFLRAVNKEWRLPREEAVFHTMNLATWLKSLKGSVILTSGNMLEREPSGRRRLSLIGEVTNMFTNGKVVDLLRPDRAFPLPVPEITDDKTSQAQKVIEQIAKRADTRNELILCWDENLGEQLAQECLHQGLSCTLIRAENEGAIEQNAVREFSNSAPTKKILISTGKMGAAVNFVQDNGQFPNFHISVLNPEHMSQIWQGFSRRRLLSEESDFALYYDEVTLLSLLSKLPGGHGVRENLIFGPKGLGYRDLKPLIFAALKKEPGAAEKLREHLPQIYETISRTEAQANEQAAETQLFFDQEIIPLIVKAKEALLEKMYVDNPILRQYLHEPLETFLERDTSYALGGEEFRNERAAVLKTGLIKQLSWCESSMKTLFYTELENWRAVNTTIANETHLWQSSLRLRFQELLAEGGEVHSYWQKQFANPDYLDLAVKPVVADYFTPVQEAFDVGRKLLSGYLPKAKFVEATPVILPPLRELAAPTEHIPTKLNLQIITTASIGNKTRQTTVWCKEVNGPLLLSVLPMSNNQQTVLQIIFPVGSKLFGQTLFINTQQLPPEFTHPGSVANATEFTVSVADMERFTRDLAAVNRSPDVEATSVSQSQPAGSKIQSFYTAFSNEAGDHGLILMHVR